MPFRILVRVLKHSLQFSICKIKTLIISELVISKVLTRDSVTISVDAVVYYRQRFLFMRMFITIILIIIITIILIINHNNNCKQGVELNNVQNVCRKCPSFYLPSLSGLSSSILPPSIIHHPPSIIIVFILIIHLRHRHNPSSPFLQTILTSVLGTKNLHEILRWDFQKLMIMVMMMILQKHCKKSKDHGDLDDIAKILMLQ